MCCSFMGWGVGQTGCLRNIYTAICTHQLLTLVTTISCRLCQSNGSMTCPFARAVTAGFHNEGVDIFIPLR